MVEESANSLATWEEASILWPSSLLDGGWGQGKSGQCTSAMRLMFSLRSFSEKPRSLFSPNRTLSPSRR